MARVVYVPELDRAFSFNDNASNEQISQYIRSNFKLPTQEVEEEPAPAPEEAPDESGIFGRAATGFLTSLTDIPGGIASMYHSAERAEKTPAGQISRVAREAIESTFGIDRTKPATITQEAAEVVGGIAGLLVPSTAAAKVSQIAGAAPRIAKTIGVLTGAGQGAALGAQQRSDVIRQQLESGMQISPEQQLTAQRLDAVVGASDVLPISRFLGPVSTLLSKVPASKIGIVERILENRLGKVGRAAIAEGSQELAQNIANDLVEYGVYNPDVAIGEDVLSNAAMGAFGGSLVETVVQVAAGRKMRPYRQLQKDLADEGRQNAVAARQGKISRAAEELRRFNVDGPVEIEEGEVDNTPLFQIKTKAGNFIGDFTDREAATEAVDLYQKRTGAKVAVTEPFRAPTVFPVKIGNKTFSTMDEIVAERDAIKGRQESILNSISDRAVVEQAARDEGVAPEFYKKKMKANAEAIGKKAKPFEDFIKAAAPKKDLTSLPGLVSIPYTGKSTLDVSNTPEAGESQIIDYVDGRKMVVKSVNGVNVPFYLSSGRAGKNKVPAGKWYPFFGVGPTDGWINKGSQEQMVAHYGSSELKAAAEELDATIGDIRDDDSIVKVALEGDHVNFINQGFDPADNAKPDSASKVGANIKSTIDRIQKAKAEQAATVDAEVVQEPAVVQEEIIGRAEEAAAVETPPTEEAPTTTERMDVGAIPGAVPRRTAAQVRAENIEPREYTQEQKDFFDGIASGLKSRLEPIVPKQVSLDLQEMIDTKPGYLVRGHVRKDGTSNDTRVIIELSRDIFSPTLTIEQNIAALTDTLNHEIIHALRTSGVFRPAEWNMLSKAALNVKVPGKSYTYFDRAEAVYTPGGMPISEEYEDPDAVIEEAVAEMYKDWVKKGEGHKPVVGLFNRVTEFFRRIFRVFQSKAHESVFKKIESGEVGGRTFAPQDVGTRLSAGKIYNPKTSKDDWISSGAPPRGISSINTTGGSPFRISQRRPTSVGEAGTSLTQNLIVDVEAMRQDMGVLVDNISIVKSYPGFPVVSGETPEQTLVRFKQHIVNNLLWLHDTMDPELRKRAKLWYDGARRITDRLSKKYDLPDTSVAAVVAGLSPQKDWFQNVSLAERLIDIVQTKGNFKFSEEMLKAAKKRKSLVKYRPLINLMQGKTLNQMDRLDVENIVQRKIREKVKKTYTADELKQIEQDVRTLAKAMFVRLYDEAYNPREYNILTPEGDRGDLARTNKGNPAKVAWGSFTEIGKGVSAIQNGTKESVDRILGDKHKIRNFYNNIISPNSTDGSVTIDTHAVAAALLRPLSGSSGEVHHNFGTSTKSLRYKTRNSKKTGLQGLYAIYADAYRDAAKARGVLPREMQSITWEAVRGLYRPTFKAQAKNVSAINSIWNNYKKGKENVNSVRKRILLLADPGAKGLNSPFWKDTPSAGVYGVTRNATDAGGVVSNGVRQATGRTDGGRAVGDAGRSTSRVRYSATPLPPYVAQKNSTLFAPEVEAPLYQRIFGNFLNLNAQAKTLTNINGVSQDMSWWDSFSVANRSAMVDDTAYVAYLEKLMNKQMSGNFERMTADYSATAALAWKRRSTQLNAAMVRRGMLTVDFLRPGDIQSATVKVVDSNDSLLNVIKVLSEPGEVDPATGKQKDKREIFKSYAAAMRGRGLKAAGETVPRELDDTYINTTIPFVQQNYPEIVEAYKMYQRFNRNLLDSARKAQLITDDEFVRLTRKMDYYSFYHEVFDESLVPGISSKTASKFNLRPYTGSQYGNLMGDPVFVMIHNAQFWVDAITKNIAVNKAFEVARYMNEARILQTGEEPDQTRGEARQVMFMRQNGIQKRFAVKDPMLVLALGSDDRSDVGAFMKFLGMPTQWLRESVTRDPGFIFANLARDTLSAWITSGEDITPFISTAKGMANALKKGSSFQALMGRGVVGSYDLAMLPPVELANKIRKIAAPKNVHFVPNGEAAIAATTALWDKMGALSEASDAATRIAIYESALKQGLTEAEAAFRAIEVLDFSRRGGNQVVAVLTKLIPFLNARIQGLDVLWQAGKAAGKVVTGKETGEREGNIGKSFLVRGGMLAVASMILEMINSDDEDYQQLDDYIKDGNLLIPLRDLGLKGEFLAIPKPFEAGILFSTFPQMLARHYLTEQDVSRREVTNLFLASIGSTFGMTPIPQIGLPALEVLVNHDFYTGLPLISEGKSRLANQLQYNSNTSQLAFMLSEIPIVYDFSTGKFEGMSPIAIDNLISGYAGPLGTYLTEAVSASVELYNATTGSELGVVTGPRAVSELPVVRRFFVDAKQKNPKVVTQAYEQFRIVDEVNRSYNKLRKIGDAEAVKEYLDENRDILSYKRYVFKLVEGLNNLSAQQRRIEADPELSREEKFEALRKLRETRIKLASKVKEINDKLNR